MIWSRSCPKKRWRLTIYLFGHLRSDKLTCRDEGGVGEDEQEGLSTFLCFCHFLRVHSFLAFLLTSFVFRKALGKMRTTHQNVPLWIVTFHATHKKKPEYKCRYKCYKSWGMIILCQTSLARNEDYGMRQSKVTRHFDEIIFNSCSGSVASST